MKWTSVLTPKVSLLLCVSMSVHIIIPPLFYNCVRQKYTSLSSLIQTLLYLNSMSHPITRWVCCQTVIWFFFSFQELVQTKPGRPPTRGGRTSCCLGCLKRGGSVTRPNATSQHHQLAANTLSPAPSAGVPWTRSHLHLDSVATTSFRPALH